MGSKFTCNQLKKTDRMEHLHQLQANREIIYVRLGLRPGLKIAGEAAGKLKAPAPIGASTDPESGSIGLLPRGTGACDPAVPNCAIDFALASP